MQWLQLEKRQAWNLVTVPAQYWNVDICLCWPPSGLTKNDVIEFEKIWSVLSQQNEWKKDIILGDGDKILNLHLKRLKKRRICICFRTISLALGSYRKQVEKAKRTELNFRPRLLIF